jgi:SEC-C motif
VPEQQYGTVVEERARQVAARLGLADFVYSARLIRKGAASREPGDGVLYANGCGAILQVKSRHPNAAASDGTVEAVQAWVSKHARKALSQGRGSRREIARQGCTGRPVRAVPVRAMHLPIETQDSFALGLDMDVSTWPIIVVVDHPHATWATAPGENAFWITLDDWVMLHRALRSVTGLLEYVTRCLQAQPVGAVPLGREAERFAHLVDADEAYAAAGNSRSVPFIDHSSLEDPLGAELYRDVLEHVWPPDDELSVPIADYRRVIEHMDALPPSVASGVGRWIAKKRGELHVGGSWSSGAVLSGQRLTVYACDSASNYDDGLWEFDASLAILSTLRAHEAQESGRTSVETLGIGVLTGDGWIDYRYFYAVPPVELSVDDRRRAEWRWGRMDFTTGRVTPLEVRRNDPCPCGGGKKYKACCSALNARHY